MNPFDAFLRPEWLALALAAPVVALVLRAAARRHRKRVERMAGPRVAAAIARTRPRGLGARPFLSAAALLLAAVALARPVWGESDAPPAPGGVDVVVCLDVSRSMLARDVAPSRLARAQREIADLARHGAGDRFALVLFAGEARLASPLTRDTGSFVALAAAAGPLSVERGGTDLGEALTTALDALGGAGTGSEAVVLLTDGEDLGERGLRVAGAARERGIAVHCVGLGTAAGAKIPVAAADGRGERFLRDRRGAEVVSALDATGLRRIAEASGGEYADAASETSVLPGFYDRRIAPLARKSFDEERRRGRAERFQLPLLAALGLWLLDLWLGERR